MIVGKEEKGIQTPLPEQVGVLGEDRLPSENLFTFAQFLKATAIIPTDVPRNTLDYFRLYVSGATRRLYVYDSANATWRFAVLS